VKPRQPEPRPAERSQMAPGDEAAPGTPGTGEDICPGAGTGKIIGGIGGA
jgi:hypothetical protein